MNCCDNCFKDTEIKGFIFSNSIQPGKCDFCQAEDANIIDPRELEELFQPVINLFRPIKGLSIKVPQPKLLHERLQEQWKIFNFSDLSIIKRLLAEIVSGLYPERDPLLNSPVEIGVLFQKSLPSVIQEQRWDHFADEIKYQNRYFLNETVDLDLLQFLLSSLSKTYKPGKIFYRGRISESNGFPISEMGKPPSDKTHSGRANPNGIPYLYVSTTPETTVYETRSSYLDFLSVAEFKLIVPLNVISLREISDVSPFVLEGNLEKYVIHQKYLSRLEKELSKPIRRFDKELDYLPSQYLCEYVKSLGYDAIEYSSSLKKGGINLAVFNDTKLEIRKVAVYEITSMDLKIEKHIPLGP
jgi:hypothetical protein